MACIVMAGVGIAFGNESYGQTPLDALETALADDTISWFANDEIYRRQRIQTTAFLRIWSWPEAAAAFKFWISS